MSADLRVWAATGRYADDDGLAFEGPGVAPVGGPNWQENARLIALIPVGILLGALFATALAVRVLATPFSGAKAGSDDDYLGVA